MGDELARLIARAQQFAQTGETLSAAFARELAKVFRDADRALRTLITDAKPTVAAAVTATRAVILKTQIREALRTAGYDTLVASSTSVSAEAFIRDALEAREMAQIASLAGTIDREVEALRRIAAMDLFAQGDEVATALWRSAAQHLLTTRPVSEIVQDLADALDGHEAGVRTLFDTQTSIIGRQVEAIATEDLGADQPFLFVGPIDDRIREWCLEHVGQVFTRADIDAMDNEQLPNCFLTGGGYNCRHSWLAVESKELRAMVGTGERVEPVAADVTRVRARKAAKKAA